MTYFTLDVSSANTGWTLLQDMGRERPPRVECGSFACRGRDIHEQAAALSDALVPLLRDFRARGVKIERAAIEDVIRRLPMRKVRKDNGMFASEEVEEMVSNPNTMIVLPALVGAAAAILHQFKIPTCLIAPATWRKGFIGVSRAPRHIERGKTSKWLKVEVRQKAEMIGQRLGFTVKNYDVSDSIGIAFHLAATEGARAAIEALRRAA